MKIKVRRNFRQMLQYTKQVHKPKRGAGSYKRVKGKALNHKLSKQDNYKL